jgi:hypothetical protein
MKPLSLRKPQPSQASSRHPAASVPRRRRSAHAVSIAGIRIVREWLPAAQRGVVSDPAAIEQSDARMQVAAFPPASLAHEPHRASATLPGELFEL